MGVLLCLTANVKARSTENICSGILLLPLCYCWHHARPALHSSNHNSRSSSIIISRPRICHVCMRAWGFQQGPRYVDDLRMLAVKSKTHNEMGASRWGKPKRSTYFWAKWIVVGYPSVLSPTKNALLSLGGLSLGLTARASCVVSAITLASNFSCIWFMF